MHDLEKRKRIHKIIVENLTYYEAPMNETRVRMFAEELMELSVEEIQKAYAHFRNEPGRKQMPMPADIKSVFNHKSNTKDAAAELAANVLASISRHGWNWIDGYSYANGTHWEAVVGNERKTFRSFEGAVEAELGPHAWKLIKLMGGWIALHDEWAAHSDHGTLRAQMRDLAQSIIEKEKVATMIGYEQLKLQGGPSGG